MDICFVCKQINAAITIIIILRTGIYICVFMLVMLLQRSIDALKLKNSVEKATLNDIHMHTIKVSHVVHSYGTYCT